MSIRTLPVRSRSPVPLGFLPQAINSYPKLYGVKMINLILLALLLAIGSLLTQVLVLLPIGLGGWLHFPNWLGRALILLAICGCGGDESAASIHELLIIGQKLIIKQSASPNGQCPSAPGL